MKQISEERLKRASYAIERGLLEDIVLHEDGTYSVSYEGEDFGNYDSLEGALQAWDAAEAGGPSPVDAFDEEFDFLGDYDAEGNYREDMVPTWDEYDFDEDGYKLRRR